MLLTIFEVPSVELPIILREIDIENAFVSSKVFQVVISGKGHIVSHNFCLDGDLFRLALFQEVPELTFPIVSTLVKFALVDYLSLVGDDSSQTVEFTVLNGPYISQVIVDRDRIVFLKIKTHFSRTCDCVSVINNIILSLKVTRALGSEFGTQVVDAWARLGISVYFYFLDLDIFIIIDFVWNDVSLIP